MSLQWTGNWLDQVGAAIVCRCWLLIVRLAWIDLPFGKLNLMTLRRGYNNLIRHKCGLSQSQSGVCVSLDAIRNSIKLRPNALPKEVHRARTTSRLTGYKINGRQRPRQWQHMLQLQRNKHGREDRKILCKLIK